MILIGSRALLFRAPFLLNRPPKDFDFVGYKDEILQWLKDHEIEKYEEVDGKIIAQEEMCEFEIVKEGSSAEMLVKLVENDEQTIKTEFGMVPNLDLLFTLKKSHRYLKDSPHFFKNLSDYTKMRNFGCKVRQEYNDFFKKREKETYKNKLPKLNVKKNEFFNGDGLVYIFDHDSIHVAMKHFDKPAYEYYKKDGEEVMCDKEKFFALPEEYRLYGVREEIEILSIERSIVPFPGKLTPKQAFFLSMSKTLSSITGGWFREFAYEHAFEVIKMYRPNYVEIFEQAVKDGIVKLI